MLSRLTPLVLTTLVLILAPHAARAQCPTAVNLTASSQGCDVRLTWQNTPGAPPPLAWAIFRRPAGSGPTFTQINTVLPGNTIYTDSTTSPPASYVYFVRALVGPGSCAAANLDSEIVGGSTSLIPKLGPPRAGCSSITLIWNTFPGATSFVIERRVSGGGPFSTLATLPPTTTSYADTSALPDLAYDYRLTTQSPCGSLPQAGVVTGSLLTPPVQGTVPTSLVRNVGDSVTITFDITPPPSGIPQYSGILRDGAPLTLNPRMSISSDGKILTINSLRQEDMAEYSYSVTNSCGTVTQRVVLAVRPSACRADFNQSGGPPTVQDIFDFLSAWFAGCP